jgi:hypothetical protein
VSFFDTADCTGSLLGGVSPATIVVLGEGWHEWSRSSFAAPGGALGARVRVAVFAEQPEARIQMHFDHVRFGPAGTTPVTLQSFVVE